MKKMGRRHRPFFRVCAMDSRSPRDGRVLEELGYYDPMVPYEDARAVLNAERIAYWISVGAQPSDKVGVLIRKYGLQGTHLEQQRAALEKLAQERQPRTPPAHVVRTFSYEPPKPVEPVAEKSAEEAPAETATDAEAGSVDASTETSTTE
ncbi:MAG: 30S ribosomal protein S16 [Planctomycetia bacterium]|nr:30S ribosomal protein S16 [Planctomycetia bacterium]